MSRETKGRTGWHQATPKTSKYTFYFTGLTSPMKAVTVTLALSDWLPVGVADWLIILGGLRDE